MKPIYLYNNQLSSSDRIDHNTWRQNVAEEIARQIDMESFGVKGIYLTGSVDMNDAGRYSDIDLLFHYNGNQAQRSSLLNWLKGWDQALCYMIHCWDYADLPYLLDVHLVTDEDIHQNSSFATKIKSIYEPATLLRKIV